MEGMWAVLFAGVMVIGIGVTTLGSVALEQAGKWLEARVGRVDRAEIAMLREEVEAARQEIARLSDLEQRVGQVRDQVDFLERLVEDPARIRSAR